MDNFSFDASDNIQTTRDLAQLDRIGVHSHITGLGLDPTLKALDSSNGMVGQHDARRAAGIVSKMVKSGKIGGQCVLITGEPGTGKTALAMGIAKEISSDTPFVTLSASEVYSLDVSKTEALTQALRKSIGIRIKEETEVIEGEVVELLIDRSVEIETNKVGRITMKTTDMETCFELGTKMIEAIQKKKIMAGDVVQIVKSSGQIVKLGKSYSRAHDYDACSSSTTFVPCPEGEIIKKKEVNHTVTLHDIDVINSRTQGFLALFSGDTGEIKAEIREQIDTRIQEWVQEGKAELISGVLFVDEVHLLDIECFSFFNRALENVLSPLVVLATNRGVTRIKGTNFTGPHGLPNDLLDRLLIIKTCPYNENEIRAILKIRCDEENVNMDVRALELLTKIGVGTSLRYAMQLIQNAYLIASRDLEEIVTMEHVQRVYSLFIDENRSAQNLLDQFKDYQFCEEVGEDNYSAQLLGGNKKPE